MRPLFEKIPFPLIFKAHIFNITNSYDVINGSKPMLNEIGPYVFEEWKERFDIVDDNFKDTISYTLRNRFVFRPDLSNGLTGDEIVTLPHLIIFGSLMAVKRDRAPMLPLVVKAMKSIFDDPKTPFVSVKAMDILFNGIEFNCDGNDFSAKAVCAGIKSEGQGQGVVVLNETFMSVSLLANVS
jgi:scavenger receptor class B, member 1